MLICERAGCRSFTLMGSWGRQVVRWRDRRQGLPVFVV
jgi:hypothetical protein